MRESFSSGLVEYILQSYGVLIDPGSGERRILDPFTGSGTTVVTCSLRQEPIAAYGIEYNPFLAMVADVKAHAAAFDPGELATVVRAVLKNNPPGESKARLPSLSTFHHESYFPEGRATELISYRERIKRIVKDPKIQSFLLVGLASIIEEVSCLRKDGRMLRYVPHPPRNVREALSERWQQMIQDVKAVQGTSHGHVFRGDARQPWSVLPCQLTSRELPQSGYGLILYSPPYLNSIDYSEIYKVEIWLLDLVQDFEAFRSLRQGTITSHPSIFVDSKLNLRSIGLDKLARWVENLAVHPDLGSATDRGWIIPAYFSDMASALLQQVNMAVAGGYIVCIVGNSKYGNLMIDTDFLIAEIARSLGLEVVSLEIARWRNSRTTQGLKLRETIIVLRKPQKV